MKLIVLAASLGVCLAGGTTHAEQLFNEPVIIDESACIGTGCAAGESFTGLDGLKLKSVKPEIFLDRTGGTPWELSVSTGAGGGFNLFDRSFPSLRPFGVFENAKNNGLIATTNGVGFGTTLPQDDLHVVDPFTAALRLETTADLSNWQIGTGIQGLLFTDLRPPAAVVMALENGAPASSFRVKPNGFVGMGLFAPEGRLHIANDGLQINYFESQDGGPVQIRMRSDSENRRFLAVDNDNNVKSQIIFKDNEILFTGQTDSGANRWLTIGPSGIVSQGPTCSSPCDLTFDPDVFTVPTIEDRAAYMWEHMHLPAIGPTSPDQPLNLTEKTGGIIHELEVAHIYIEQLHTEIDQLKSEKSRMRADIKANQDMIAALLDRLAAPDTPDAYRQTPEQPEQ